MLNHNNFFPCWRCNCEDVFCSDGDVPVKKAPPLSNSVKQMLLLIIKSTYHHGMIHKFNLNLITTWQKPATNLIIWTLTHWGWDMMAANFLMTFSNTFSWMKTYEFRLRFHWSLFSRVQLTIFQHWFRWWLGADQATSHYLNKWWLVYWRIRTSLRLNELNHNNLLPCWRHNCEDFFFALMEMYLWRNLLHSVIQ